MADIQRRTRADKGSIRLNRRDLFALEWIYDMVAIFESDIPHLLDPQRLITRNAVRAVVRRWESAGIVHAEHALTYQGRLVHLTPTGVHLVIRADLDTVPIAVSHPMGVIHQALVARARLRIEEEGVVGTQVRGWVSARQWHVENMDAVRPGVPVPDGLVLLDGGVVGVVQLGHTVVEIQRLQPFLVKLELQYPMVLLVIPQDLLARAEQLLFSERTVRREGAGDALRIVTI
ncbi:MULTISPECIES: hypothetical protein [Frankia]|uniref:Uncharacterized protein n=1 Tax=Frankia alni (strain DSM 45986 / CECT 9034 / ACN14a) TaxID=326424 RepID=Q0RKN5_FRAAA|nr:MULTISPECIES: hypothetical protein [Frankia]CAJ61921.1 hypothetical protein FRAAL3277 [Frankia alni ACN14a]